MTRLATEHCSVDAIGKAAERLPRRQEIGASGFRGLATENFMSVS
jgi:hypothetical protein